MRGGGQPGRRVAMRTRHRLTGHRNHTEAGSSLIELMVVMTIIPIVVGALSIGLITVFSLQSSVANRATDASDAQVVSTNFENDVHSAIELTTDSSSGSQCGTGTQLLGLEWSPNQSGVFQSVVSYIEVKIGSTYSLVRQYCASGASTTPTSSTTVSHDIPSALSPPTVTPSASSTLAGNGWTSSVGVTGVTFSVTEPASTYAYTLVAVPAASSSSGQLASVSSSASGCNFATPGTGTYAGTLCFVDFTPLNPAQAASTTPTSSCPEGGQAISAVISGTPDTMSFCLLVVPVVQPTPIVNNTAGSCATAASYGPVCAGAIPTYFAPPTSEAFLGNNGFYMGISGRPALYQTTQGETTTLDITNIKVLDSNGNAATGWSLVTGDAESTDQGESLTWSTCSSIPTGSSTCSSSIDLSVLANTPTSSIGNDCGTTGGGTSLTGVGTNTVVCAATVSSDKTGAVMLSAPTPTTLTVSLVGTGLQAIFIGLLLP